MNELKSAVRGAASYETDYCAWSSDQAHRLRQLKPAGLDWENLAEEVESLGRSDRRAVGSALKVILEHLIKWQFQSGKRSSSWSDSIDEHRDRLLRILEDSPSLATFPGEILEQEYRRARRKALRDSRLSPEGVPATCPFTVDQALDADFWPGSEQNRATDAKLRR
jgi:hypothetical protein